MNSIKYPFAENENFFSQGPWWFYFDHKKQPTNFGSESLLQSFVLVLHMHYF